MAELPFVIEPPGDAGAAMTVAESAAGVWGLPAPQLIRVGMNALFSAGDDVVIRVGRPTADPGGAIRLAGRLSAAGIRSPRFVRHEPVVIGALAATAIAREDDTSPIDWAEVGAMVAKVHAIDPSEVSHFYPVPHCSRFPWWQFDPLLRDVDDLLDLDARAGIVAALRRHRSWESFDEGPTVLCHGDVHPGNVLATVNGPMLIDWDLLCTGPRAWDHGPLMTWTLRWGGAAGVYESFAEGYGVSLRHDPCAEAVAELRLVAATLMRLRAGRTDVGAAVEAGRRLRWWRGDPDAPTWKAA